MKKKSRRKKDKTRINFRKIIFWILFVCFMGSASWVFLFSDYVKIEEIEVKTEEVSAQEVRAETQDFLREKFFNIFPKNNIVLLSERRLEDFLQATFFDIKRVKLEKKFPDKILVKTSSRGGVAVWKSGEEYFLIDGSGRIFRKADLDQVENNQRIKEYPVIEEKNSTRTMVGDEIGAGGMVEFIYEAKKRMEDDLQAEVERSVKTPSRVSSDVRFRVSRGWEVYFNPSIPAHEQVSLLKQLLEKSLSEEEKKTLKYVDLRIKGKAIYKSEANIKNNSEDLEDEERKEDNSEKEDNS